MPFRLGGTNLRPKVNIHFCTQLTVGQEESKEDNMSCALDACARI